jgi:hypothetical protein
VEGYDATMWLLALGREISGQDLDALLVTDSESLQQKAVSTASDRHGSASSRFASWRIRPGGGFVEQPGESTVLCAAKDETSVDIMGRMFCCNFSRKS